MNKFFSTKGLDKALNITILVLGSMWLISFFLSKDVNMSEPTWEDETRAMFDQHRITGSVVGDEINVKAAAMWQIELLGAIESTDERPLVLFIYASWCPYCKRMFPIIDDIASNMSDKYRVIAFSIDESKQGLATYLASKTPSPAFKTLTVAHRDEFAQFGHIVRKKGLQFTGAIPYIAVFDNAELVNTFGGAVPRETLLNALHSRNANNIE